GGGGVVKTPRRVGRRGDHIPPRRVAAQNVQTPQSSETGRRPPASFAPRSCPRRRRRASCESVRGRGDQRRVRGHRPDRAPCNWANEPPKPPDEQLKPPKLPPPGPAAGHNARGHSPRRQPTKRSHGGP